MKGMIGKSGFDKEDSWLAEMPKMRQLMNEGKYSDAIEIYDRLPENIKRIKAVQITHIMIVSGLDDDKKYEEAINEYTTLFPNEPNMYLLLLDGYILKKEYDKALNAVNEMDKMINKDPFLDYYRYLIYNLQEDSSHARTSIETLMKNMPVFEDGMLEIIAVYIEDKNTSQADKWIKEYRMHSAFDQSKLSTLLLVKQYEGDEK
jgi:tetratricopeptide (TPR) repeat protein